MSLPPFVRRSAKGSIDRPKKPSGRHAARLRRDGITARLSCSFNFLAHEGQYLAFIYAYTRLHRRPPAEADMQRYFRVSPPSVHQMVLTLERAGFIRRQRGDARSSNQARQTKAPTDEGDQGERPCLGRARSSFWRLWHRGASFDYFVGDRKHARRNGVLACRPIRRDAP